MQWKFFISHCKIVLFTCCLGSYASAQVKLTSENFTVNEGLSENVVHSLFQDKMGFIWVGTHEGLNRYDGYGFKKYLHVRNDNSSLPNSAIEDIYEDDEGNLQVLSRGVISKLDRQTGKFSRTGRQRDIPDYITTYFPYRPEFMNIRLDDFWNYYEKNESGNSVMLDRFQRDYLRSLSSLGFYYDVYDCLWVLQADRLITVNIHNEQRVLLTGLNLKQKSGTAFPWFVDDASGNVWLRTPGKMYCLDKKTKLLKETVDQSQLGELPLEGINTILLDRSGVLWLGSFYGLKKVNLAKPKFKHLTTGPDGKGLHSNFVLGLNLHSENKLAVQHYYIDSFYTEIELPVSSMKHHPFSMDRKGDLLREVLVKNQFDISRTVWDPEIQKLKTHDYNWKAFRYGYTDRNGTIWSFYNSSRLINSKDTQYVYLEDGAEHLWDDENYMWVATSRQGLLRYHKITRELKKYKPDRSNPSSISSNSLICLFPDDKGNLWIGTRGGGLNYFDKRTEQFTVYSQVNGLSNNTIYCMLMDENKNLWMGTAFGLSCFNTQTKQFRNFYTSDGLVNTEYNRWSAVKDSSGMLYFGGMHGIDYFNPADVLGQQTGVPEVQLTDFKTGNLSRPLTETVLDYNDNFISFEFAAMDFRNPLATQYEYMLEGVNNNWIKADRNHTVIFTSLRPGKYVFKVKGATQNGQWSKEAVLSFTIKAPWWQTSWFYILCGITIAGLLYGAYRFRISQLQKLYAVRGKISRDLHDEVGATLSSIHVYSSVASRSMANDVIKAENALKQINVNARQVMENMNDIVWAMHSGQEGGISFENKVKNYGYELLTPLNISCSYYIDRDAERLLTKIEARKNILLVTKEAINNISRHSDASAASVQLKIAGKNLQLDISDNGKGMNPGARKNGNGFQNMKNRVQALGGKFHVSEQEAGGLHVSCTVPIANIRD